MNHLKCDRTKSFLSSNTKFEQVEIGNNLKHDEAERICAEHEKRNSRDFFVQQHHSGTTICGFYEKNIKDSDVRVGLDTNHKYGSICTGTKKGIIGKIAAKVGTQYIAKHSNKIKKSEISKGMPNNNEDPNATKVFFFFFALSMFVLYMSYKYDHQTKIYADDVEMLKKMNNEQILDYIKAKRLLCGNTRNCDRYIAQTIKKSYPNKTNQEVKAYFLSVGMPTKILDVVKTVETAKNQYAVINPMANNLNSPAPPKETPKPTTPPKETPKPTIPPKETPKPTTPPKETPKPPTPPKETPKPPTPPKETPKPPTPPKETPKPPTPQK